jgi:prevent-host-death family protein
MRKASVSEAKNRLSELLESVRRGETVIITDRDRPVARLEPMDSKLHVAVESRIRRLERAGAMRLGSGRLVERIVSEPAPRPGKNASAVAAMLEERNTGR